MGAFQKKIRHEDIAGALRDRYGESGRSE